MTDKTVAITGATSGIGAAFARAFAQQGYNLLLTGRRAAVIEQEAEYLREKYGVEVEVVLAELSDEQDVRRIAEQLKNTRIDILVNNAGFGVTGLYQDSILDSLEQLAKVNVLCPMALTRAVLPGMISRGTGAVINISSESVYMAIPKNAVYAGAKAFLKTFTEGLHMDLMGTGVRALAVCPGLTHTDFHERMGMDKSRQTDHGPVRWMPPELVVTEALTALRKDKVVCIPGMRTRMMAHALNLLPRGAYYRTMYRFSSRHFRKPEEPGTAKC